VRYVLVDRDGINHDVDTFADLAALHDVELGAHTAAVLPVLLGSPWVPPDRRGSAVPTVRPLASHPQP